MLPTDGFGSALADAPSGKVWVFGTPHNRCNASSAGCDGRRPCWVAAWHSSDPALQHWTFAGPVLNLPKRAITWNTAVARVESTTAAAPTGARYLMIMESVGSTYPGGLLNMTFAANSNSDLTSGWHVLPHNIEDEAALGNRTGHALGVCPFIRQ